MISTIPPKVIPTIALGHAQMEVLIVRLVVQNILDVDLVVAVAVEMPKNCILVQRVVGMPMLYTVVVVFVDWIIEPNILPMSMSVNAILVWERKTVEQYQRICENSIVIFAIRPRGIFSLCL